MTQDALEPRIASLKALIASPVTAGTLGWHFEREVDSLLDQFYDDIGTVKLGNAPLHGTYLVGYPKPRS